MTGEVLWSRLYQGAAGLDEAALAVAADADGDVYYTGRVSVAGEGIQMLTMKLDRDNGTILWTDIRGGGGLGDDLAWDIVVGPDGNPVIAGHTIETGVVPRCLTRKLSAATGAMIWEATAAGALSDIVSPSAWLAVADGGDVVMCQRGYGTTNGYDVLLARYDAADGHAVWNLRYDGATHGGDNPRGMILTSGGDVVVAGVQDVWWNYNYMTLKFAGGTGALLWQAPGYNGPPGWYDVATAVCEAPGGLIVATGLSDGTGTSWDIATVGYDGATGQQQWALRHDGPASQSDEPRAITASATGRIFVTGYAYAATTGKDWLTLSYDMGLLAPVPASPAAASLVSAWPNPFNPSTTVAFDLVAPSEARLTVHSLDGALVRTLFTGSAPAGRTTRVWNGRDNTGRPMPSATYQMRLDTPGVQDVRLITLLK